MGCDFTHGPDVRAVFVQDKAHRCHKRGDNRGNCQGLVWSQILIRRNRRGDHRARDDISGENHEGQSRRGLGPVDERRVQQGGDESRDQARAEEG